MVDFFFDNSEVILLFLNTNICCDPSLKLSCQESSNKESFIYLFISIEKYGKLYLNYPCYPLFFEALFIS